MPLTIEEQRELDEINAQLGEQQAPSQPVAPVQQTVPSTVSPNASGLTPAEEQELQAIDLELSSTRQDASQIIRGGQTFGEIHNSLPPETVYVDPEGRQRKKMFPAWRNDPAISPNTPESVPGFDFDAEAYYNLQATAGPESKTFLEQVREDIPQGVGSVGLVAIAERRFGPMLKAVPFPWNVLGHIAIIGGATALGAAGGKGWQQAYRQWFDTDNAPTSFGEIYKEQGIAAAEEFIAEYTGRGLAKAGGKFLKPLKAQEIPGAKEAEKLLADAAKRMPTEGLTEYSKRLLSKGLFITGGQASEARGLDVFESAMEHAVLGGDRWHHMKNILQPRAVKQSMKELVENFWKFAGKKRSISELGELVGKTLDGKLDAFHKAGGSLYDQVDILTKDAVRSTIETKVVKSPIVDAAGNPIYRTLQKQLNVGIVNIRDVKKIAKKFADEAGSELGSSNAIKRMAKKILSWPDDLSFAAAHRFRSDLLEEARAITTDLGFKAPKVGRAASGLSRQMDRAMGAAAESIGGDTLTAWKAADKFWREGKVTFINDFTKRLAKTAKEQPHLVAQMIFKKDNVKTLRRAKAALGTGTFNSLKAGLLENLQRLATDDATDVVLGNKFLRAFNGLGDDVLKETFTNSHIAEIRAVGRAAQLTQKKVTGGGVLMAITQAGAIIQVGMAAALAGQGLETGSAAILLGPPVLSRILASPKGAKWLKEGLSAGNADKWLARAPAIAVRLIKAEIKRRAFPDGQERGLPGLETLEAQPFRSF
jgi:hypothetical protein